MDKPEKGTRLSVRHQAKTKRAGAAWFAHVLPMLTWQISFKRNKFLV